MSVSTDIKHLTAQHTAEKNLDYVVRTAFSLHTTALQERALGHSKDRKKLLADKAVVRTE